MLFIRQHFKIFFFFCTRKKKNLHVGVWYVARTNQIAALGYVSRTNQIAALGYVSCTNHIMAFDYLQSQRLGVVFL